jgi:hypothetical protein
LGCGGFLLGAKGEAILRAAVDLVGFRDVFRRFRHRCGVEIFLDQRIDESPAQRGIVDFRVARECRGRLGNHQRRAAHAFDAARDCERDFAGGNGSRRHRYRLHSRAAQTVYRRRRHAYGHACQQRGHAGHVAIVFAGLVGAAVKNIVDACPIAFLELAPQRGERNGRQIVGANLRQGARVAADRRAKTFTDVSSGHCGHSRPPNTTITLRIPSAEEDFRS